MLTEDEVEELYVAYLIIKAIEPASKTDLRARKALKRIINKYGDSVDWRLE